MPLTAGTRLGPYEILSALGAGGMGEVYRARDTRLQRDVAIKILPAAFASDPDRLARFEQEACAAAALNHPNILAVYDIGIQNGAPHIVSELLEGKTLRELIAGLPVRKAIEYGIQIAQGLAAAHEKGIVHRDLKPDNLFVTSDGRIKILDFGLAKLIQAEPSLAGLSVMPTTAPDTVPGMVLGTIGYMAPEQVRGHAADHRADIFALGTVLYEMLAGQRAFCGEGAIDTMTAILKEDPPELPTAERHIPPALARIVDRCLEKNPAARFQSTRDLVFALEGLSSHSGQSQQIDAVAAIARRPSRERMAWGLAAALFILFAVSTILGTMGYLHRVAPPGAMTLTVLPPEGMSVGSIAMSPDGRSVAFSARSGEKSMVWIRALSSTIAAPLAGTENSGDPFWSPDSRSVAFFAHGKLNRISAIGGPVQALADATIGYAGTWNEDGVILFAPAQFASIYRVSASGGTPAQVTTLDAAKNESSHRYPEFLPDGRHFLYSVVRSGVSVDIRVGDIESGKTTQLAQSDTQAAHVRTPAGDYLLFTRQAALLAQAFDIGALRVTGEPTPVTEETLIRGARPGEGSRFSVSASGVIAYRPGGAVVERELMWTDRAGKSLGSVGARGLYEHLELAPDGKRLALSSIEPQSRQLDIWLMDVASGSPTRFTFEPGEYGVPHWSRDGTRLTFGRTNTRKGIYEKPSNGAGVETQIFPSPHEGLVTANDWSPDGRFLVFANTPPQQPGDLWMLPLFGDRRPVQVSPGEVGASRNGRFSPDGRWLAYESQQAGSIQVYVQPFPASGAKWQISSAGGMKPRWRRDGKELYFIEPSSRALMAAPITGGEVFQAGVPKPLFTLQYVSRLIAQYPYDVSADGQRFVIISPDAAPGSTPITVLLNWSGQPAK